MTIARETCYRASTITAWAGEQEGHAYGAAQAPIVQSAPFTYTDMDEWLEVALGRRPGFIYSRNTNPTVAIFEEKLRMLEGAESATSFATGMAAISNTLFALLNRGDRVISVKDTYGGTSRIFLDQLPRLGVEVVLVDTEDAEALEREIAQGCTLVYLESPTNPTLKIIDLRRMIACAQRVGAITIVDNTFATPINQRPLDLGADLVVHSATKFLGGHDDALGGVLAGRADLVRKAFEYREITGATLSAFAAYLLLRGMKTLELRVERQNATALRIAKMLSAHTKVDQVFYPGLANHPGHAAARVQMKGFGGVLSFSLARGAEAIKPMLEHLRLAHRAASLGSVNTLAGPPATTSHVECTAEQRRGLGIPEALIRYSCGVENADDLIDDLNRALSAAG